jgi:hypothetical protein
MAPQVGLEPTTLRLTAECSTIELLRSNCVLFNQISAATVNAPVTVTCRRTIGRSSTTSSTLPSICPRPWTPCGDARTSSCGRLATTVLVGTRYDWLRHPARMEPKDPEDRKQFAALRDSNLRTARAWGLKETMMEFFDYRTKGRPASTSDGGTTGQCGPD